MRDPSADVPRRPLTLYADPLAKDPARELLRPYWDDLKHFGPLGLSR